MRCSFLTAAVLAFLALAAPAHAATVVKDSEGVAIGILNLEVEGFALPFNVNFEPGEWQDIYGGLPGSNLDLPVYDFDSAEDAAAAVEAVIMALNDDVDVPREVGDPGGENNDTGFFAIGYKLAVQNTTTVWLGGYYSIRAKSEAGAWIDDLANNPFGGTATDTPMMWADFAVVPVPAAAWLFGSALGLLGWIRKRTAA